MAFSHPHQPVLGIMVTLNQGPLSPSMQNSNGEGKVLTVAGSVPLVIRLVRFLRSLLGRYRDGIRNVPFSEFLKDARAGKLAQVLMGSDYFDVTVKAASEGASQPGLYRTQVIPHLDRLWLVEQLEKSGVTFGTLPPTWARRVVRLVLTLFPFIYLAVLWKVIHRMYNPSDSVGKQHVRKGPGRGARRVTFADVAGIDAAKLELNEIVDFLRDRSRYVAIGAKLPKGILLSGPSGTGKTLLARAVANESGASFISCSASDFVEMLVGRGAARVRDIFRRGASRAPCILFIDELDALAKTRGGLSSNDEREQTLNQLLTEMDGFDTADNSVVVIAATNRPEVLDPALTRPGRFDRHVHVGLPDTRGRRAILDVHLRDVRLKRGVDVARLAAMSRGFSGAELANVVNEAALLAVRAGETEVGQTPLEHAIERTRHAKSMANPLANTLGAQFMRVDN